MFFLLDEKADGNSPFPKERMEGLNWLYYDRKDRFQGQDRGVWFGKKLVIFNSGMFKDNKIPSSVMKICELYNQIPDQVIYGYFGDNNKTIYMGRSFNPYLTALVQAYFVYSMVDYGASTVDLSSNKRYILADPMSFAMALDARNIIFSGLSPSKWLRKIGHSNAIKGFDYIEKTLFPDLAKERIGSMIGNPYQSYLGIVKEFGNAKRDMENMWKKDTGASGVERLSYFYMNYLFKLNHNPYIPPVQVNDSSMLITLGLLVGLMTADHVKDRMIRDLGFIPNKEISFSLRYPLAEEAGLIQSNDAIIVNEEQNIQLII